MSFQVRGKLYGLSEDLTVQTISWTHTKPQERGILLRKGQEIISLTSDEVSELCAWITENME